jgi:hypothetical protein
MKTPKSYLAAGVLALAVLAPGTASAAVEALNEGFSNVAGLPGWTQVNNSVPEGISWFQGNAGVFGAHAGAADGQGVVDNWLITPVLSLSGLTSLSFRTRSDQLAGFSDFLEVRFAPGSTGGTNGFTTLLGTVGGAAGHPSDWAGWSTHLSVEGEGRFAFRYVGYADTLNYIGLDTVRVVTAVPEPSLYVMLALGLGALGFMRRKPSI